MMTITMTETETRAKPQAAHSDEAPPRLTVANLFGFLLGRRDAILAAARDPATMIVGFLFVCAAAVAREYDGEDLRREPWHLLIPLGVSLALSLLLFLIVRRWRDTERTFWPEYRAFLGLFWLTAPLALLYGIPYERLLSPVGAVQANLWTLALVATWRVALMTRVVSVFTGRSLAASFFLVFVLADLLAAGLLLIVPVPTLQVMGGIRLTEAERLLQSISLLAAAGAALTAPVWLLSAIICWFKPGRDVPPLGRTTRPAPKAAITLAAAAIAVWFIFIPFTQREQRLRRVAERLLRRGDIAGGLAEMSRHERRDYPPAWDPPPRIGWPEPEQPAVMDVMQVLATEPAAPWVRADYVDKFERRWLDSRMFWTGENTERFVALLNVLPEGAALKHKYRDVIGPAATQPAPTTTQSGVP
jgi:hypothetical protein